MLICLNCYYKTRHAGRLSHHSFSQLWRQGSPTSGWQLTWFWGRIHAWSRGVCPLTESSCDSSLPPSFYAAPSSWPHIILITSQEVTASTQGLGESYNAGNCTCFWVLNLWWKLLHFEDSQKTIWRKLNIYMVHKIVSVSSTMHANEFQWVKRKWARKMIKLLTVYKTP